MGDVLHMCSFTCPAYVFIYISYICLRLYVLFMSPFYMSFTCLCLHVVMKGAVSCICLRLHVGMEGTMSCMCLHLYVVVKYAVSCICLHLHILHMSPFIYPVYVSVHM